MANFRLVSPTFWTDSKIQDDFTPEDKYFFLYLLTNPQTNICGCYELGLKEAEYETGYKRDKLLALLDRFEKVHKLIAYNPETKEVFIFNWYKYNLSRSEKTLKGARSVAQYIKTPAFKDEVLKILECLENGEGYTRGIQGVYMGYTYPIQASVSVSVSDSVSDSVSVSDSDNPSKTVNIDSKAQEVIDAYNAICTSLPQVRQLTDKRRKAIKDRLKKYDLETLKDAFTKAQASDFLTGKDGKWRANFDWLMYEYNLVKVLEDNYINRDKPQGMSLAEKWLNA